MNLNDIVKIQDVDLKGKTVLMRVDYNVPLKDGKVDNPKRITATEKTVKYLLGQGCKLVLIAHLGRPKGKVAPEFSLAPVAPEVEKIMGTKVHFGKDCIGAEAAAVGSTWDQMKREARECAATLKDFWYCLIRKEI